MGWRGTWTMRRCTSCIYVIMHSCIASNQSIYCWEMHWTSSVRDQLLYIISAYCPQHIISIERSSLYWIVYKHVRVLDKQDNLRWKRAYSDTFPKLVVGRAISSSHNTDKIDKHRYQKLALVKCCSSIRCFIIKQTFKVVTRRTNISKQTKAIFCFFVHCVRLAGNLLWSPTTWYRHNSFWWLDITTTLFHKSFSKTFFPHKNTTK